MPNPQQLGAALQFYDGPQKRDASSFVRALLADKRDPQLPQYDPEGGWNTAKYAAGRIAALSGPGGVADAFGMLGEPSAAEQWRSGNKVGAGLTALGAVPGLGIVKAMAMAPKAARAGAKMAQAAETVAEAPHIIAYHGSPHSFDRFDMSKIGTGEGAQAYGHGLYFAEHEPVAKGYRDNLASGTYRVGGEVFDPQSSLQHMNVRSVAVRKGIDDGIARARQTIADESLPEQVRNLAKQDLALLEQKLAAGAEPNPGSMYQVRINADPEHFLDWDKPLSEQSPVVQEALKRFDTSPSSGFSLKDSVATLEAAKSDPRLAHLVRPNSPVNPQGNSLYEGLANDRGAVDWPVTADAATRQQYRRQGATGASDALREAGIPGIKYLDQGSRSAGEGSRNYVVFDDNLVEILKKYGLVGLLGGGAAMGAAGQQGQEAPQF